MPLWHKAMLALAAVLLGGGVAGQVSGWFAGDSSAASSGTTINAPNSSHFIGPANSPESSGGAVAAAPSWRERISPWMSKVGLSFIVGLVVGWVFRAFLKVMSLLGGALLAILLALSYFNVLNIDMTAAREQYASTMAWATDQAHHLAKAILNHLPGSTSSFLGLFVGFRRR